MSIQAPTPPTPPTPPTKPKLSSDTTGSHTTTTTQPPAVLAPSKEATTPAKNNNKALETDAPQPPLPSMSSGNAPHEIPTTASTTIPNNSALPHKPVSTTNSLVIGIVLALLLTAVGVIWFKVKNRLQSDDDDIIPPAKISNPTPEPQKTPTAPIVQPKPSKRKKPGANFDASV